MKIETMDLQQLSDRMRELGMKTSKARISDAIEQGLYPFAICIKRDSSRIFEIYTKAFNEWVESLATLTDEDGK